MAMFAKSPLQQCLEKKLLFEKPSVDQFDDETGFIVGKSNGKSLFVHNEKHMFVIGGTGSGKTRGIMIPNVINALKKKQNIIFFNTKIEGMEYTMQIAKDNGYKIHTLNLIDTKESDHFNPLAQPEKDFLSKDESRRERAENFLYEKASSLAESANTNEKDAYWAISAKTAIYAASKTILLLKEKHLYNAPLTFAEIYKMIDRWKDNGRYTERLLSKEYISSDPGIVSGINILSKTGMNTGGTHISTIGASISKYLDNRIFRTFTSETTFDFEDILEGPSIIYVTVPATLPEMAKLAGNIIEDFYQKIVVASDSGEGKLKRKTIFVLDEFANLGLPKTMVTDVISEGRTRNINVILAFQNISQLNDIYEKAVVDTIIANAVAVTLPTNDPIWSQTMEENSGKRIGEFSGMELPNLYANDVLELKPRTGIVKTPGNALFKVSVPDLSEYGEDYNKPFDLKNYHRERHELLKADEPCVYKDENEIKNLFFSLNETGLFNSIDWANEKAKRIIWDVMLKLETIPFVSYDYPEVSSPFTFTSYHDAFFELEKLGFWRRFTSAGPLRVSTKVKIDNIIKEHHSGALPKPKAKKASKTIKADLEEKIFKSEQEELEEIKKFLESLEYDDDDEKGE